MPTAATRSGRFIRHRRRSHRSPFPKGEGYRTGYRYTNDRNFYLAGLDYGNGDKVEYTYDEKGRLICQTYEDGDTVTYQYDNDGALAAMTDSATGRTTRYFYDTTGRVTKYTETGTDYSHSVEYRYDTSNNLTTQTEIINGVTHTTSYTYDTDNRVTSKTTDGVTVEYTYDTLGRITQQVTKNGDTTVQTKSYTYTANSNATGSTQISSCTITAGGYTKTYSYSYDDNGNIVSFFDGDRELSYQYDSANQVIRENNTQDDFTRTWTYDNAGNILSAQEYDYSTGALGEHRNTVNYAYGDSVWGDLLTGFNGQTITYDGIGNPTSYRGNTLTWEHGRTLTSLSNGTTTWTYTYDADGMRTQRANGSTTYNYVYNGSQLVQMTADGHTLNFTYDANGTPLSVTMDGTVYYYITNIQGDVMGIQNANGNTELVYEYDAWGQLLYTNNSDSPIALNPLRYRGYVYDVETELYYLQSRYYDPYVGRFINGDGYASTGQGLTGNNMFAYCGNNPVCLLDPYGTSSIEALDWWTKYMSWLCAADGPATFGDAIFAIGMGVICGAKLIETTADYLDDEFSEKKKKTKVLERVITNSANNAKYYGAEVHGDDLIFTTPAMTYEETIVWIGATAISGIYGKKKSWGVYTSYQSDAFSMTVSLYPAKPVEHFFNDGEYPHYHVFAFIFLDHFKHFHIWFGNKNGG